MSPKENLREEHGNIMKIFSALQKILPELEHRKEELIIDLELIIDFLEIYTDKCHHGKEENILFPALEELRNTEADNLTTELRSDHRTGRVLLKEIKLEFDKLNKKAEYSPSVFIDTSKRYIGLFRKHIRKENAQLLPMIEERFSKEQQARIEAQFERFEHENIGPERYEAFKATLEKLT